MNVHLPYEPGTVLKTVVAGKTHYDKIHHYIVGTKIQVVLELCYGIDSRSSVPIDVEKLKEKWTVCDTKKPVNKFVKEENCMNLRVKLTELQELLLNKQQEELNIVNALIFLMFGRDSEELPKRFEIECTMDNEEIKTFLKEKVGLDVKDVSLVPLSILNGKPIFRIELN